MGFRQVGPILLNLYLLPWYIVWCYLLRTCGRSLRKKVIGFIGFSSSAIYIYNDVFL